MASVVKSVFGGGAPKVDPEIQRQQQETLRLQREQAETLKRREDEEKRKADSRRRLLMATQGSGGGGTLFGDTTGVSGGSSKVLG